MERSRASGSSARIDPSQIPRPPSVLGHDPTVFETRGISSANAPPVRHPAHRGPARAQSQSSSPIFEPLPSIRCLSTSSAVSISSCPVRKTQDIAQRLCDVYLRAPRRENACACTRPHQRPSLYPTGCDRWRYFLRRLVRQAMLPTPVPRSATHHRLGRRERPPPQRPRFESRREQKEPLRRVCSPVHVQGDFSLVAGELFLPAKRRRGGLYGCVVGL